MALNFSESGLFVRSTTLGEPGEILELTCDFGRNGTLALRGHVIWRREADSHEDPRGFGIHLIEPSTEYVAFVGKFRDFVAQERARKDTRVDVTHQVKFQTGYQFLSEYCENLSRGGLYLATTEYIEKGEVIAVTLEIPGAERPLTIDGKVLYSLTDREAAEKGHRAGVGLQFVNLSAEATVKLQNFIKRLEIHRGTRGMRQAVEIPPEGSLHDHLVPEILIRLFETKWTGLLHLSVRGARKTVYLRAGKPVYVESPLTDETFGRYLVRMGVIGENTMLEISEELTRQDFKFGEILLHKKLIDPATLSQYLVNHQEEKLSNALPYFDGAFQLEPKSDWPVGISFFPMRLFHVLFSGAQHWYDEALVRAWFGIQDDTPLRLARAIPAGVEIPSFCLRIVNLLRQPQTVNALAENLKTGRENVYPVLFVLILAGWLAKSPDTPAAKAATKPEPPKPLLAPEELGAFREQVVADYASILKLDFFQLFDIKPNDSIYGIDAKYFRWIEAYDPKRVAELRDADLVEKAGMVLATVKMAFETIKDSYLRQLYVRRNASVPKGKRRMEHFEADLVYIQAVSLLEQHKNDEIIKLLEPKEEVRKRDPSILGLYAWALYESAPEKNWKQALDLVDQAVSRNPADAQLRYFRGRLYEHNKATDYALEDYQKSIALQPGFMKAEAARDALLQRQNLKKAAPPKKKK